MAKKNSKAQDRSKNPKKQNIVDVQEPVYSEKVEKTYKIILRVLSWVVGIAFITVIILPEFNSPFLDKVTKILFYIGIINLLIFIIIEFIGNSLKRLLGLIIDD